MILNTSYAFLTFPILLPKDLDSCAETYSPQNQFLISIDSSFISFLLSFVSSPSIVSQKDSFWRLENVYKAMYVSLKKKKIVDSEYD